MAIWVKIRKIKEINEEAFYKIYKQDYQTVEAYMKIDKKNNIIAFFLEPDFCNEVKVFNVIEDWDKPMGSVPGISSISYRHGLIQGIKLIKKNIDTFPEILDYCA